MYPVYLSLIDRIVIIDLRFSRAKQNHVAFGHNRWFFASFEIKIAFSNPNATSGKRDEKGYNHLFHGTTLIHAKGSRALLDYRVSPL